MSTSWFAPLLALALAALPHAAAGADVDPAVLAAEAERVAVIERADDAVLAIFSGTGDGGGSGVVITPDGYALTNFHVAQPSGAAMKCGMADGRIYDAVIVGYDPTGDVALIKLFGRDDFPHAEIGDSDTVRVGDWVYVMGNPFLLSTDFQPTVTYGIVSGVHRYQYPAGTLLEYADCIQTDASINPGNSGGPLFDAQGRLVGINGRGSFEKRGRVNVGVGYAISINQIKNFLGQLHSGRVVDHATLGAVVAFDEEGRVAVTDVLQDSDAYRRGLRYDDEVISLAGRPVTTPNGFKNILGTFPKGWRVPLSYRRNGQRHDILVRLSGVHSTAELLESITGKTPAPPGPPEPEEKPKPRGGEPEEDLPGGEQPSLPMLPPQAVPSTTGSMPEIVKTHFEEKRGYANYFFNKQHRSRVLDAWRSAGDLASASGTWSFSGPIEGGEYRMSIGDDGVRLDLPSGKMNWQPTDDLAASLEPAGSGGLFAALWLWRRLAVVGPEGFGEVYYLGTAPLPGRDGLVDVVVAVHGGVECRFYFDSSQLLLLELFPQDDVDPCEVSFSAFREFEGHARPGRLEVHHGDETFASFEVGKAVLPSKEAGAP